MKISPYVLGVLFFAMGFAFIFFAVNRVNEEGWGFFAILFSFIAAHAFLTSYRYVHFGLLLNKKKK
ncbi:DUF4305 domain-containing protein [Shouchella lonarensis]|uniref:DUF4305 domain-containing protein n=1 Tax=Shouchella lonarensis TaxID=1464122 RepID=A0A1G6I036_9BACI|nr:DUF4305 domain-containing protein [Shouchella lonarensis]SDB99116.1 protein of unknown function [Shouchella lonarensis]